jgi:acyl dehydratase
VLDPDQLLNQPPIITRYVLSKRDTILYALGVGAEELDFVFEERLQALPTMAAVLGHPGFFWREPEYGVDAKRILHGEQSLEILARLPVEGEIVGETRIDAVVDKGAGKGAAIYASRKVMDGAGKLLAMARMTTLLRGDGGFGGATSGGTAPRPAPPERIADHRVALKTAPNQALIYRLSGDYNPLHIDPGSARAGGFSAPIFHGLCTYGVAGRALLSALCDNDAARLKQMDVRFSSPVYPGETIVTEIWRTGVSEAAFRSSVTERQMVVLNNGYVAFA